MNPQTTEQFTFDNRTITLTWFTFPLDPTIKITQVSAYCLFNGKLVLVRNKRGWGIPGGHPESGETVEQTLARELNEEADIKENQYTAKLIGWMKAEDPNNQGAEGKEYAQLRYLVTLNTLPKFVPDEEIFERTLIEIDDFSKYISWGKSPTGAAQLSTLKETIQKQ